MTKEFIVDVGESEISIAVLEDKQLVELHKEYRDAHYTVGDIFLGRVKKISPGLNAAFVDVGYEKDAFLHYSDLGAGFSTMNRYIKDLMKRRNVDFSKVKIESELPRNGKIEDVLTVGQPILVQIAKEPISTKGPRVSADVVIVHRNLVLVPFNNKISISQKIRSGEEKKRLMNLIASIMPRNFGVIIRTAGEGKKVAVLNTELQTALDLWTKYERTIKTSEFPVLIASEINRASTILRDLPVVDVNNIYINDKEMCADLKTYMTTIAPEKEQIVKYYGGSAPIMEHFDLVKSVKSGFGRYVTVKNGIYLVIDHTEALHVIDVNSGLRTTRITADQEQMAMDVNMAAAEEIARQLRLRDMGGIIVIDFVDLYTMDNRRELWKRMIELMHKDRAKHHILPLSRFGLMQITRHRVRPEMKVRTLEQCPCCNGTGKVGSSLLFDDQLETQIASFVAERKIKKLMIHLHPYVVAYLRKGLISQRLKWCFKYKCKIKLVASQKCAYLESHFFDPQGETLEMAQ